MWYKKRKIIWWIKLLWLILIIVIIFAINWYTHQANSVPSFEEQIIDNLSDNSLLVEPVDNNISEQLIIEPVEEKQLPAQPRLILLDVPFTAQAPYANWADDRFQDGCEEAAVIMAMAWVRGEKLSKAEVESEIIKMSDRQTDQYGNYHDTNAADTAERLFKTYFNYPLVNVVYDVKIADIKNELAKGHLVLVPTNGQRLHNPYYTPPGPTTHMLVIKGYDPATEEFITNDPGTKRGENYRYNTAVLWEAILDYPTGNHEPIMTERKAMIVVTAQL